MSLSRKQVLPKLPLVTANTVLDLWLEFTILKLYSVPDFNFWHTNLLPVIPEAIVVQVPGSGFFAPDEGSFSSFLAETLRRVFLAAREGGVRTISSMGYSYDWISYVVVTPSLISHSRVTKHSYCRRRYENT